MSFLTQLEKNASKTRTFNGAAAYSTTGEACLDFFSVAGGMRYRSAYDQTRLFTRAYIENPELAMKLLFYIRDIREGMGERQLFRTLIRYVAKSWPESARKNVHLISEYGRFDDMLCLMGTKSESEVIRVIKEQLAKDLAALDERKNGNINAPISLLAKWMPSINTSSRITRGIARKLAKALGMSAYDYRKMLTKLRNNICLTERYLTDRRHEKIKYSAVPAGAMFKYRDAFARHDKQRFMNFVKKAMSGKKQIHCANLFPYAIFRPIFNSLNGQWFINVFGDWDYTINKLKGIETLEALWKNLPADLGNENAISVIDTSGSMYWPQRADAITPALISQSLGLYHAEHCKGRFHNHFITFSSVPELIEIHGETLKDKLRYIQSANWGFSTNLEAVFDLILYTAIEANSKQDEIPSVLYIISDMEFNCAIDDPSKTVYENARAKFESFGYQLPAVVFINVNSWQMQAPVTAHQKGAALASGMGISTFKHKFDGNMTPMSHMLKVLMSDRYKEVHA